MKRKTHFLIGELAERTGVAPSALRFYDERGLIDSTRNASGYRVYPRWTTRKVAFIVFAQRVGLSLGEVAEAMARLPRDRAPSRESWGELTTAWQARIDERIAELRRLREGLTHCIGCGCLSLEECPLSNPGDRAGRNGPGPRFWMGDEKPGGGEGPPASGIAPREDGSPPASTPY